MRVAPALVPQLDGDRVVVEDAQELREIVARRRAVLEARRELRQQRAQTARRDASGSMPARNSSMSVCVTCASRSSSGPSDPGARLERCLAEHLRVRELLIELERELEARRRPLRPGARHLGARLPVEGRVHLDGVEVLGVEAQLVEVLRAGALRSRGRIEEAVPRPLAGRVVPARGADAKTHAWYNTR